MTSTIKEKITDDMKAAMRAQDKGTLGVIRLMMAALKQREVDERIVLSDEQILAILNKMIKQRRESIAQYEAGNRPDLVQQESFEIEIIQRYLPALLSEVELQAAIQAAFDETGATSAKDMGKVMAVLKTRLQGRADMAQVSALVKARLSAP
jgi:uncharacterized protein